MQEDFKTISPEKSLHEQNSLSKADMGVMSNLRSSLPCCATKGNFAASKGQVVDVTENHSSTENTLVLNKTRTNQLFLGNEYFILVQNIPRANTHAHVPLSMGELLHKLFLALVRRRNESTIHLQVLFVSQTKTYSRMVSPEEGQRHFFLRLSKERL